MYEKKTFLFCSSITWKLLNLSTWDFDRMKRNHLQMVISYLFLIPYTLPYLFLIKFHPYIFLSIKKTNITNLIVAMETYVVICFFKQNYYVIHLFFILHL